MEILEIIARPLAAGRRGQHFAGFAALSAAVDVGQIVEKRPRALEQSPPGAVVIGGQGIEPRFDVREVLAEQNSHVREQPVAIGDRPIGMSSWARASLALADPP